ncbi:hypothetical protein BC829DRAFT_303596 [Chytridium lagenaria]|nr:hypothetical protein BC829DRAFT_303596 [Chytridium lagenaria]
MGFSNYRDVIVFNYFALGLDVVIDKSDNIAVSFMFHTNSIGHDFGRYTPTCIRMHSGSGTLIKFESPWEEILGKLGGPTTTALFRSLGGARNKFSNSRFIPFQNVSDINAVKTIIIY